MYKISFTLIFLILLGNLLIFSQTVESNKHSLQVCFGGQFHVVFGEKHIAFQPRDTIYPEELQSYSQYGGFDRQNSFSYELGIDYKWKILHSLFVTTGIGTTLLREVFISPSDTVLYYNSLYPYHKKIIAYKNNIYRFYVPICVGYEYKFFSIQAGMEIDFLRYYNFKQIYISKEEVKSDYFGYKYYWERYNTIHPIVYFNFCLLKKASTQLNCTIGARMVEWDTYDLLIKANFNFGLR